MKTTFKAIAIVSAFFFVSCQKGEMNEQPGEMKACQSVNGSSVPAPVLDAFTGKYPNLSADKWFNKDGKGFAALFTQNGTRTVAQFDTDGTFRTENVAPVVSPPQEGDHPKSGCNKKPKHRPHPALFRLPFHKKPKCERPKNVECQVVLED